MSIHLRTCLDCEYSWWAERFDEACPHCVWERQTEGTQAEISFPEPQVQCRFCWLPLKRIPGGYKHDVYANDNNPVINADIAIHCIQQHGLTLPIPEPGEKGDHWDD